MMLGGLAGFYGRWLDDLLCGPRRFSGASVALSAIRGSSFSAAAYRPERVFLAAISSGSNRMGSPGPLNSWRCPEC